MSDAGTLTIVIPTLNRAHHVVAAVESLRAQTNTSGRWQVLVADNGSTDDTRVRLTALVDSWPRLRLIVVEDASVSRARNAALATIADGYVLFADDECRFATDYIDRALRIIDSKRPCMFGGPVLPRHDQPAPAWLPPEYGAHSLPWATGRAQRVWFCGGNVGFDVAALRAVGGFDVTRGMRGTKIRFGEDIALEHAMLLRFGSSALWFDPEFVTWHTVRPEKYRWQYLMREQFFRGKAAAELTAGGQVASAGDVPVCLRAGPRPAGVPEWRSNWRQRVVRNGFRGLRVAGALWARLRR